jgi:hypothetical protein
VKCFLRETEHGLAELSKILALEIKGAFRRSAICSVSATIGIDWSISRNLPREQHHQLGAKKTVSYGEARSAHLP